MLLTSVLILSACSPKASDSSSGTSTTSADTVERIAGKYGKYSEKDLTVATEADTTITLQDQGTKVTGEGVKIDGDTVTITKAGTYEISGSLSDGQLVVAANKESDDVQIILNGVTVGNSKTSPFFVESADKVIVTLAEGSTNQLTDGADYTFEADADEPDATIFSKADLTFNGTGKLKVTGNYKDGIRSKDDLVFIDGQYDITAANNGLKGNDSVSILAGTYTIDAKNDGIQASNTKDATLGWVGIDGGTLTITAEHDGIQAETALNISDGTVKITTAGGAATVEKTTTNEGMMAPSDREDGQPKMNGERPEMDGEMPEMNGEKPEMGGEQPPNMKEEKATEETATTSETDGTSDSAKGLKAGTNLQIDAGKFTLDTADDSLHANGNVTIDDGTFTIASGDDGIHADGTTTINNGTIHMTESYEGIEGATIVIAGGTMIINSSDDGINAASSDNSAATLDINGGFISVSAEGDGVDSNGDINMTGGTLLVNGPTSGGNGALDYDGTFNQTGGTLIAVGSSGMAMATSETSSQPALSLYFDSNQKADTLFSVSDETGKVIATYQPTKAYQHVVISTPELKEGSTYHVSVGGKVTGENQAGLYTDGSYTGDELLEVTLTDTITSISQTGEAVTGNQMGGPGGGGRKGQ